MQTELDMRDLLFPKEQVPASTPIPPREVGTISSWHDGFLSLLRQRRSLAERKAENDRFLQRRGFSLPIDPARRIAMPPPDKVEVLLFWASGIVVMILSGAVAIYASHLHLWDVH
jgi:hypothetical protein